VSLSTEFFERPILNSPYEEPQRHWALNSDGQPTQLINDFRRSADFVTPIPKAKISAKKKDAVGQIAVNLDEGSGVSTADQQYGKTAEIIRAVRQEVGEWRKQPTSLWGVTPETARLLEYWRGGDFTNERPFFCQVEAAETTIWLAEVAPNTARGKPILAQLKAANDEANPDLFRIALKLATGAGKTTIMAMLIAWQTVNAVRHPNSKAFTTGFLIVTPGITIKDRLRVLRPNDPDNYYKTRQLVPMEMYEDLNKAKIVITNYHAFKRREIFEISKGGREFLRGRTGDDIITTESEGQMLQRVAPELLRMKNVMVINDEAHHCYREKPIDPDANPDGDLRGEELKEAKRNAEAARLWINGLEALNRKVGVRTVLDLSATPFFLSGSGYVEGTLFPWVASDFSLMDAIECGIVKLPRVPIGDNVAAEEGPIFRNIWAHIGKDLPKKGRTTAGDNDPLKLPVKLQNAIEVLYGNYKKTFDLWKESQIGVPPAFIIVCQNTSISKLVYDYVSGFERTTEDGTTILENGRCELFRNFDDNGNPLPHMNTLLIDSQEIESGEAIDPSFRKLLAPEIERFRRERVERSGRQESVDDIKDEEVLREVMNTVGKAGQLGANIRCVVSVSMLTEGWDANNVTHVLGVRAFGTQLLCEQVIGRALRRQSYDLNEEGLFNVEYANVFGIPFDFAAQAVNAAPQKPRQTVQVKAMRPERDHLEIKFPRVVGYKVDLPNDRLTANFNENSKLVLSPKIVGPASTDVSGIIGAQETFDLKHLQDTRRSTILYHLTTHLIYNHWRGAGEDPALTLFGEIKRITAEWMDKYLVCTGGTYEAQLVYKQLADMACERIAAAIVRSAASAERPVSVLLDPYNPEGTSANVRFTSSKSHHLTDPNKAHLNYHVLDSTWEGAFCRVAEAHPKVIAYVKNQNMGFEVPYRHMDESRRYLPDFILLVDDGHGPEDLLRLIVEVKGFRGEDVKDKQAFTETYWIPGVNHLKTHGRWDFVELSEIYELEDDFDNKVKASFDSIL
jgi:type III restriction enzyme